MPLKRFHLNGQIARFHPRTQKLKLKSAILSFTKGDVKRYVGLLMKEWSKKKKPSKPNALVTRNLTKDADSKFLKKSATKRFCPDFVGQFSVKTLVSIILSSKIQIAMKCRPWVCSHNILIIISRVLRKDWELS